ncbi:Cytochrome P450 4F4 [Trichoplax sp. H2]|uniref:Cytochrome P450 n=1 Tax=Trichoplax adhaerens TaxID=10228 RepID=B3RLA5_TRIAD|nr:hypothetical protein TRIADDRAFT_51938 [Trichoplax adhaerens]EDV28733.1 hypothetical protein TRIADDRAFT_51938 [Trichoplax adhaerens]RDD39832.1 Cytochrome P450 4F4 [Trichoplax sp. H2]|eukprot:XP_002107935.1 hypothetical protein TRIADDRAFT_51938 [Trichoplax adhaerens]
MYWYIFFAAVTILFCLIGLALESIAKYYAFGRALRDFPGPPASWVNGNLNCLHGTDEQTIDDLHQLAKEFPKCYRFWLGPFRPTMQCIHPDIIKAVLSASQDKDGIFVSYLKPWLGNGLLTENGQKWQQKRRLIGGAFNLTFLSKSAPVIHDCVKIMTDHWNVYSRMKRTFDMYGDIKMLSFDIIMRCAFSGRYACQVVEGKHPFVKAFEKMSSLVHERILNPSITNEWLYWMTRNGREFYSVCDLVHKYTEDAIHERQKEMRRNDKSQDRSYKNDFLDILLSVKDSDGQKLLVNDIRDEINSFIFSGYDTLSNGITWSLYCLGKHRSHQRKVRDEVNAYLQHLNKLEWEDITSLKYTIMCVKEALRLYPPVPFLSGRCLDKDIKIEDVKLPTGCPVEVPVISVHHQAEWWPDPMTYDPLRFTPEKIRDRHPFAYLPFSAGSRKCLGQIFAMGVVTLVVAKIIQRYDIRLVANRAVKQRVGLVLQPKNGVWIEIVERNGTGIRQSGSSRRLSKVTSV